MAPHCVCVLALAAVLLLGIPTISRSKGLKGQGHQRALQIPSQFSPGERFAMKEALKGEPGPLRPAMPKHKSLSPRANPCRPTPTAEGPLLELEPHHIPQTSPSPSASTSCPGLGTPLLPQTWLLGTRVFPASPRTFSSFHHHPCCLGHHPAYPLLCRSIAIAFVCTFNLRKFSLLLNLCDILRLNYLNQQWREIK